MASFFWNSEAFLPRHDALMEKLYAWQTRTVNVCGLHEDLENTRSDFWFQQTGFHLAAEDLNVKGGLVQRYYDYCIFSAEMAEQAMDVRPLAIFRWELPVPQ